MTLLATATGLTMAAGGLAKLAHVASYERLVAGLDWGDEERRAIGAAELAGGVLMLLRPTRRLGAGLVLAASGAALAVELRSGGEGLAAARGGIMVAAHLTIA